MHVHLYCDVVLVYAITWENLGNNTIFYFKEGTHTVMDSTKQSKFQFLSFDVKFMAILADLLLS